MDSVPQLLDAVGGYLESGYVRIKLKIEPGWDVEPVRAVRERFGNDVLLQVDANTAYTLGDAGHLAKLDPFDLLLIEQPLAEDDMRGHAELSRKLRTPVCLDESVTSPRAAAEAIALGACAIINIKPGRVGGYLAARQIRDRCRERHAGLVRRDGRDGHRASRQHRAGRRPGFTLPGDMSASDRFYARDITEPVEMVDGEGAGCAAGPPGVERSPIPEILGAVPSRRGRGLPPRRAELAGAIMPPITPSVFCIFSAR